MDAISLPSSQNTRRSAVAALLLALGAAVSLGIYERSVSPGSTGSTGLDVSRAIGSAINGGVNGFNSVAALLAGRSPGERAEGALANLKHKRQPILHQRALAKVRRPAGQRPLGTGAVPPLSSAPFAQAAPAAVSPLYNAVAAAPATLIPAAGQPPVGGPGGGSVFPSISPPGGGGGVIFPPVVIPSAPDTPIPPVIVPPVIVPPIVVPPVIVPPVTPSVSPVPEPATWAMMLIGFVLIGWITRRERGSASWVPAATQ